MGAHTGQTDIVVAYGHLPDEYMTDSLAAHTTIFTMQINNAAELKLVGRTSVQGCGPLSLVSAPNGQYSLCDVTITRSGGT